MAKRPETLGELQARGRRLHEYESVSYRDIAEKLGKAPNTIANWAERGMPKPLQGPWVKGCHAAKLVQAEEDLILEVARKRGMTKDYLLGKVQDLLDAKLPRTGKANLDAIDKGLTHAERIIPGLKAAEKLQHDFPAQMLAFFQGESA